MPRQAMLVSQHGFNKGELSPDLHGRKDWAAVYKGVASAKNVVIRVTGGAVKAPGTKFVAEALDQGRPIRFIPFKFGSAQTYMLEFGEKKFRILHRGGLVVYPEGHEKAGEVVVLDSPFTLDQMQSMEIEVDAGIRGADYTQKDDTLILVHATIPPKILTRHDHHDWRWSEFAPPPPLLSPLSLRIATDGGKERRYIVTATGADGNGKETQSYPSDPVTTGSDGDGDGVTTLEWKPVEGATGYRIYREFDTGTSYEYRGIGNVSGGNATTFTDNNTASGNAQRPPDSKNPFYSTEKYPSIAQFDRNRLWMGAPSSQPNQLNGSRLGEFKNFDIPSLIDDEEADAEDACEWQVDGGDNTPTLLWLASHKDGMIMGSADTEFIMQGSEPAINPDIKPQSYYGGTAIKPAKFNESIITVSASRAAVIAWAFNAIDLAYMAKTLSKYSDHIFRGKRVVALASQGEPENVIFCVLSNGEVALITFDAREDQIGVSRRNTAGAFETCEAIANAAGGDDIYFQTARTVNGETKRFIEIMAPHHFPGMPLDDAWYVDCGMEYRGGAKKTFTGLDHLEGCKISVLADGVDFGLDGHDIIVKNGAFSIPMEAAHVIAGLPYFAEIKTIDMAPQGMEPNIRSRAPVWATVSFYHSRDCAVSCGDSEEDTLDFLDPEGETTTLKGLVSKTFTVPPDPEGSLSSSLTLRSYSPVPWGVMRIDMVVMASQSNNMKG